MNIWGIGFCVTLAAAIMGGIGYCIGSERRKTIVVVEKKNEPAPAQKRAWCDDLSELKIG